MVFFGGSEVSVDNWDAVDSTVVEAVIGVVEVVCSRSIEEIEDEE